jgi:hypothetical protein
MALRIGIAFDNTIVCCDEVFVRIAKAEGLIPGDLKGARESDNGVLTLPVSSVGTVAPRRNLRTAVPSGQ